MTKKKPPRRNKQAKVAEALAACPYCGTTESEKSALSLLDSLVHSQAELCGALRLVGRQMLRFEPHSGSAVERIRKVLKRAQNIQKALKNPDELTKLLKNNRKVANQQSREPVETRPNPDRPGSGQSPSGAGNGKKPPHRLTRPHSHRVLRFPTGERWA